VNSEFEVLGLHPQLVQAVTELGYTTPTPIQSEMIPLMLAGNDVIGQAQTGTGKTAAFALPVMHNLDPNQKAIKCMVLAPTRELAMQVANAFHDYGKHRGMRVLAVYGGQPYERQKRRIKKGLDVVVGTPGRMLDLIKQKVLDLSQVETVVLDEADEMLSMGFIEDIEAILKATPADRQTALFSATLPAPIRKLAGKYMRDPQSITIERKHLTVEATEQRYYLVNQKDKLAALTRLFEIEDVTSALIFTKTRVGSGQLASELTQRGFSAEALNGDLSQDARIQVLKRFRSDKLNVLVATDVAARGLDIDDISHVFNYDMPYDSESYVHRIGRTGRAGKTGIAITLLTPSEQWRLGRIENYTRQKITKATLPTPEEIISHRENILLMNVEKWLKRDRCQREREIVNALVEAGHDPLAIAAVTMKLARAEEKQRPIGQITKVKEYARGGKNRDNRRQSNHSSRNGNGRKVSRSSHEEGMVRLSIDRGKKQGVRPQDIVGTIASCADIPGKKIGKIFIQDHTTMVDIPERFVANVFDNASQILLHNKPVNVERA
jgi:ATP-dependent RNA helicase DeaD